ncbi:hypothetical protein V1282_006910 [Nitrobacteraceae bacterium AZCC 2146]
MTGSRPRIDVSLLCQDLAVVALLAGLSVLLFRDSLANGLYIGNPDRLNSNLKILKFYVDGLAQGHLDAWSPFEMLGYDSFTLPYTFPSLFTLIAYLGGISQLYIIAGYDVIALLGLAGIAAYAFLRAELKLVFPALIGAVMYEFSALSILKVGQNDLSFAVFIFIPVIMLAIRSISRQTLVRSFVALSLLIFLLLHFTFLQKAAYALILAGCYALYRTWSQREWRIAVVFGGASLAGLIGALPRLYGIAVAIKQYSRVIAGMNFDNFADVYNFQGIYPLQMLRWFDVSIFGRFPSEAVSMLRNSINLTEGFLLYTSSLVPFFVIFGLFTYGGRPLRLLHTRRNDASFFFWFLCFTFSVIAIPWMLELVWLLFMRMDFTHARILIVGLLPLSMVVGLLLADMSPRESSTPRSMLAHAAIAMCLAILLVGGIELIVGVVRGSVPVRFIYSGLRLLDSALIRIVLSAIVVGCLMAAMNPRYTARPGLTRFALLRRPGVNHVLYLTIGLAIGLHTFLGANFDVNGAYTRTPPPFRDGNNHYSTKDNFRPPSPDAIAALNHRLENNDYRAALLCDPRIAGGFCAGHVPGFWRLRVVDGYYGLGVPTRLAILPWKSGLSLRTISFTNPNELDWPMLSLLNVKYAARIPESLYRNNSAQDGEPWKPADPNDVEIIPNPLPVTPRYFFTRHVVPVANVTEAAAKLIQKDAVLVDLTETSFVEGGPIPSDCADGKVLSATGNGDNIRLEVAPSNSERFLVANELYFPGWSALVNGKSASVYPTNAVMRGVVVPAGTTTVELVYTPVVRRPLSFLVYGIALLLLVAGALFFGRSSWFARP